jgi:hypothetical protein
VRLVVDVLVEEDCGVEDADVLLAVLDVRVAEVLLAAEVAPGALPPEEHPVRTIPQTAQALAVRTSWRGADTARR